MNDSRLARLTELCAALPEVTREDAPPHASFRVRGKVFLYWLDDHHGDGATGICLRASWRLAAPKRLAAGVAP